MPGIMTPDNIQAALESLESELPSLTGKEAWETIKDEFRALEHGLQESDDPEERDRLASELVDLLVPYERARDQLREETRLQHIRAVLQDTIETDLSAFVATMSVNNNIVEPSADIAMKSMVVDPDQEEAGLRLITIKEGGIRPGKSIKIRNFHLDLPSMTELIAGASSVLITVADPVIAGVLLIIGSLTKVPRAITSQLSEQETGVFWGLVLARDRDNAAEESLIEEYTNDERMKHGRLPLTGEGVRDALHRLEKLRSVELVEGKEDTDKENTWRIVEKYEIK
ncbi:MAG: hypothetical protein C5S48_04195 [Candidatus Methanogaster sp.]|nr:MAG: hypothetical protein C5S48_04195 [ANME-2 cluster archaeon]